MIGSLVFGSGSLGSSSGRGIVLRSWRRNFISPSVPLLSGVQMGTSYMETRQISYGGGGRWVGCNLRLTSIPTEGLYILLLHLYCINYGRGLVSTFSVEFRDLEFLPLYVHHRPCYRMWQTVDSFVLHHCLKETVTQWNTINLQEYNILKFTRQPGGQSDMVWCYSV